MTSPSSKTYLQFFEGVRKLLRQRKKSGLFGILQAVCRRRNVKVKGSYLSWSHNQFHVLRDQGLSGFVYEKQRVLTSACQ